MRRQVVLRARRLAAAAVAAGSALAFRPVPSTAQTHATADASGVTLAARTRAFLEAVNRDNPEAVMAFFPAAEDFTYVHTRHRRGGDRVAVWRFPAAEKAKAAQYRGPLWIAFILDVHGQTIGLFRFQAMARGTSWRRANGTRFVPKGAAASSAAFVEWRRENGQWVVSSFGDESFDDVPLPAWVSFGKDVDG